MGFDRIVSLGAPNYGKLKGKEGLVLHTPENFDPSIEAAIGTARWQAGAGNTSGGSYHGILGHDDERGPMSDGEAWVLAQTVPFSDIAGSITSNRDPSVWRPDRFPRLKTMLSDAAYKDPNAYLHALALGGKAAWWKAKISTAAGRAEVRGAFIALAVWVRRLEVQYDYDAFLNQHRFWQINRSDADGGITTLELQLQELVLDEYRARFFPPAQPEPEPPPAPLYGQAELDAAVLAATTPLKTTITNLQRRLSNTKSFVDTAAVELAKAKEA